ncbi:MAG: hypothetical protein ABL921_19280, partial [Pirellula sp.]
LLAQTLLCLWNAPSIRPWDALALDEWAASGSLSHGEICSVRFLLGVWDQDNEWQCGKFDALEALRFGLIRANSNSRDH